jgi:hypothetical protein
MTQHRFSVDAMIDELPAGLDRAILRILSFHKGQENGISAKSLLEDLARLGFDYISCDRNGNKNYNDRPVRAQIVMMRRNGCLIGAKPGKGYYLITSRQEYEDFKQAEYAAKIKDMSETMRAMDKTAEAEFGSGYQPVLF